MTTESETNSEILDDFDVPAEAEVGESIEESILGAINEVTADEHEAEPSIQGDEASQEPKPVTNELSEAARTLAKSKRKGRQVVEAESLEPVPEKPQRPTQKELKAQKLAPEKLDPPQRWDVPAKEEFLKLPDVAKKQVLSFWGGVESHTTKLWQDLNRQKAEYQTKLADYDALADHYKPHWHSRGLTGPQATAQLWATHERLIKDPESEIDSLMQKTGITPEQIYARRNGGAAPRPQQPTYQQPQQNNFLTREEIPVIFNQYAAQQQSQVALNSAVTELQQLRNEVDQSGRYSYPELWNDAYIQRVKPLVEDVRKTQPHLSWTESTKQAILAIRFLEGKGSPSPSVSRLPARTNNDIERAKAASVSVRGRGNPIASVPEAKTGERIEDSIRAVWAASANNGY